MTYFPKVVNDWKMSNQDDMWDHVRHVVSLREKNFPLHLGITVKIERRIYFRQINPTLVICDRRLGLFENP